MYNKQVVAVKNMLLVVCVCVCVCESDTLDFCLLCLIKSSFFYPHEIRKKGVATEIDGGADGSWVGWVWGVGLHEKFRKL